MDIRAAVVEEIARLNKILGLLDGKQRKRRGRRKTMSAAARAKKDAKILRTFAKPALGAAPGLRSSNLGPTACSGT